MTTNHTPGPWHIANGVQIRSNRDQIAKIWMMRDGEGHENARLIAAAPDLLEALQWYEAKAVQMGRAAIDQDSKLLLELMKEIAVEYGSRARAAVAKATGEQQ